MDQAEEVWIENSTMDQQVVDQSQGIEDLAREVIQDLIQTDLQEVMTISMYDLIEAEAEMIEVEATGVIDVGEE